MKNSFKKIGLFILLGVSMASCTPNGTTENPSGNPTGGNPTPSLLQIRSNSAGNASNLWDLQKGTLVSTTATSTMFSNIRIADPIVSSAGLLSQTTMTWQSSAYDKVNKKYAVSLAETVVIYDMASSSVPTPTTYNIATGTTSVDFIMAMQYVGGTLFVIQNNEIKKFASGVLTSIGSGIMLPTSGISSDTVSNMTSNGNNIYFALIGRLYTFDTSTSTLTSVPISGWVSGVDYNGIEYCNATNKFYSTKRYSLSYSTPDDFVKINLAGNETTITSGLSYAKDYSRISSAVDQATNIYYLSSSDGFGVNTNTITEINLTTLTSNTYSSLGYGFGLEYKD